VSAIDSIKKHPALAIGVGVGALLLIVLAMNSSNDTVTAATPYGSDVSAGNDLQAASLAANAQITGMQIAADAQEKGYAASIELANIDANSKNAANVLASQIAGLQITRGADSTDLANTLQASVINNQTNASVTMKQIDSNTSIATTNAMRDLMIAQGNNSLETTRIITQGQTDVANIQANTNNIWAQIQGGVAGQQIAANKEQATQSWFSKIFG